MLAPIRDEIESIMLSMGFANVRSPDIVHATIYRIMGYESRESISSFVNDMLNCEEKQQDILCS
jgi:hypothetical protein